MDEYLKKFQSSASVFITSASFIVIWFFGAFYCNPYTGTDENLYWQYLQSRNNYCKSYDEVFFHISNSWPGLSWYDSFLYALQVLGVSCTFEAIGNYFAKSPEIVYEDNSLSMIIFIRIIQLPAIMFILYLLAG